MNKFKLFFMLVLLLFMISLSSCNSKLSGKYGGDYFGSYVTFEFEGNKVTTNAMGYAATGTYKLNGSKISMSFNVSGQP